jgi:hypothetical protein
MPYWEIEKPMTITIIDIDREIVNRAIKGIDNDIIKAEQNLLNLKNYKNRILKHGINAIEPLEANFIKQGIIHFKKYIEPMMNEDKRR